MIEQRFRSDYIGEFVIVETKWSGGKKQQTREWVANPIENHHISGRAVCIGSDFDRFRFDYTRLSRHRGGLLGSKKLQTYGTGFIAEQMRLDFTIETNPDQIDRILESKYQESNIVYTNPRQCIAHPGEFYLIPYIPRVVDIALLPYLAAFDGHKEIFLLGYNKETAVAHKDWVEQVKKVFETYSGVKFYVVGEKSNIFSSWLDCYNVEHQTYREWISYCDV